MGQYTYVAFICPTPGREQEFDHWYDTVHMPDVARMPGVVSARRFNIERIKTKDWEPPAWRSMAIYELETDDPEITLAAIREASGTEIMPLSDAMTKDGMLTIVGRPTASIG
ncbi:MULTISPECIES: hypothetical protein [unclassified Brevundimonas]|uniref:hypothetical protein n=1 Tax=unclassified Brevundimonas TaxID=2622653 RepID=UPI001A2523FE|nr:MULTISPECIES: hypothetical protein [unclassified Brevundimonas]MBJ7483119.1 hypothetical protein [Brevundimonas sp.]WGM47471.1 hypothetical protein KOAAANKH_02348 [Brevundimonas sp. NIBR10]